MVCNFSGHEETSSMPVGVNDNSDIWVKERKKVFFIPLHPPKNKEGKYKCADED